MAVSCRKENLVRMNLNVEEIAALTDDVIRRMTEVGDAVAAVEGERTYFPIRILGWDPLCSRREHARLWTELLRLAVCEAMARLCTRSPTLWLGSRYYFIRETRFVASPMLHSALDSVAFSLRDRNQRRSTRAACLRPLTLSPHPSPISRLPLPSLIPRGICCPLQVHKHDRAARR